MTLTHAQHSSSAPDGTYTGESCGMVLELEDGFKLYFAGDTNVFGDMSLIGRIYSPDVAILPIGDHFTMGPREAAVAIELLGVIRCVPCHYGTFGLLTGTPDELRSSCPTAWRSWRPSPGRRSPSDARALVRLDRTQGAFGRLRGGDDLEGALVLDDVSDLERIRAAHLEGTRSSSGRQPPKRSWTHSPAARSPACSFGTKRSHSTLRS